MTNVTDSVYIITHILYRKRRTFAIAHTLVETEEFFQEVPSFRIPKVEEWLGERLIREFVPGEKLSPEIPEIEPDAEASPTGEDNV